MRKLIILLIACLVVSSCSAFKEKAENGDEPIVKKKRINPNVDARAREAAEKGGGLLGNFNNKGTNTFDFATSNVLWRATLETLNDLPLTVVDYSGGVVITDWYSSELNSQESIKLTVRFLSSEIESSSIKVISHKKKCINDNCQIIRLKEKFDSQVKDKIFAKVRILKIQDEKKKK